MLEKSSKIYVAGHNGLVGSAIWNNLLQRGYTNLVGRSHKALEQDEGKENQEEPCCSSWKQKALF